MKTFLKLLILTATFGLLLPSCQTDDSSSSSGNTKNNKETTEEITAYNSSAEIDVTSWSNSYSPNASSRDITSDAPAVDSVSFSSTVYINLSAMSVSSDGSSYKTLTDGGEDVTVTDNVTASLSDGVLLIDSSDYEDNLAISVSGTASGGSIEIDAYKKSSVKLLLDGASITSGNYPAINVSSKATVYLVLGGTNTVKDGRSYGTGYSEAEGTDYYTSTYSGDTTDLELTTNWAKGTDTKGTVYTKGPLIISGEGSLSVTEGYKHGIYSKDYIRVLGGTIEVNTTGRNAIQAVNGFVMEDGDITITGTGTNTNNESRGIIVEGSDEDSDYAGEGFIIINGGSIDITTVSKAISAKWDITDDAETTDTADDPYPYILITGGEISIKTTGTPADESTTEYDVLSADGVTESETTKLSPEGIEGKQAVFITGGVITAECTDDVINASRDDSGYEAQIVISGGNIYVYSSANDAIDSNGDLTVSGGVIVAVGLTTVECAFDCDDNTFAVTGGLIAGIGTNNYSEPTSASCTQSTVVLSGDYIGSGGTTFALEDSDGNAVFAFGIPSALSTNSSSAIMIFSSPEIKTGTTYKAVSGVTASGGTTFSSLYTDLPTVSGGTVKASGIATTTSNYVYTLTSSTNGGAQEGSHQNSGPGGR